MLGVCFSGKGTWTWPKVLRAILHRQGQRQMPSPDAAGLDLTGRQGPDSPYTGAPLSFSGGARPRNSGQSGEEARLQRERKVPSNDGTTGRGKCAQISGYDQ